MEKYKRYKDKEKRKAYNREYQKEYMRKYRLKNPNYKPYKSGYFKRLRERAIKTLNSGYCSNCGCDKLDILEVNHVKGQGNKDRKLVGWKKIMTSIANKKTDLKKYNVLCRVCNAQHYVQDILGVKGHSVKWKK